MGKIIAFWSKKGGTGKSTSSIATFDYLTKKGFKTLFLDLDEQCNSTVYLGLNKATPTILELFENGKDLKSLIKHTKRGDIIPSHEELSDVLIERMDILYNGLKELQADYDYIILDCAPSSSEVTINALYGANELIIPCESEEGSLSGIVKFGSTLLPKINEQRKLANRTGLKVTGFLLTKHNARSNYAKTQDKLIEQYSIMFGSKLFDTRIRICMALNEAKMMRQSIFGYAPESNAAKDYEAFVEELLNS